MCDISLNRTLTHLTLDTLAGSGSPLLDHPADPPQQLTLLLPEVESNTSVLVLENYNREHNCLENPH